MTSSSSSSSSGLGFAGALTIAFIVLKLTGVITWSWWWVLAPLWISWAVFLFFLAIGFLIFLILAAFHTPKRRRF